MNRSVIEIILGALVLVVAGVFLFYSYTAASMKSVNGYNLVASFSNTGGLGLGDSVQISGVKVGTVSDINLDPDRYLANVIITIDNAVKLPDDTAALISSESLLGGRFMSLEPGASDIMLEDGEEISFTQAPQNIEQLLGQFIFSMQGKNDNTAVEDAGATP